ncbi:MULTISPECIES: NAD(P)/FAD-dependent oxidoreductase [Pasteurellaceae]|uniref:FAD-binding oxidoreductase n=1 Tax=Pasteurella atlantica TaxID=2827233 RepID=A0AAW8CMP5_9PAST|nr:FAD-binding oxidoreductase [Pasteurella atlantica]MBR0574389.1 FAD-binding oxidoreductase [Pasteurella atlantica]MDP8040293.1 FAD-binding oxidoreductase [Pasteurella atlantica]MDP8042451.1 FAD-binding oxidoreductase [Pasteurella atlantica]MDP8044300.1 FAD-binding oxidoreductase [Pasteurella atlantica]MDP8046611.1 FAD-binding oxidoreductase [Pasteurella atlantica]
MLNFAYQEHKKTYYSDTANIQFKFTHLSQNQTADVCIIGAGFTGLSTALELAEQGKSVIVLDGARVGFGASGRSGGQAINGFEEGVESYIRELGLEKTRKIWDMSLEALDIIQERIKKYNIQCDWQQGYATLALNERRMEELELSRKIVRDIFDYKYSQIWNKQQLQQHLNSDIYHGALYDSLSGHLHPLNYCLGLAKACQDLGVQIYEHSPVIALDVTTSKITVKTEKATVIAQDVVLATNAYISGLSDKIHFGIANKILPVESFIIATEPLEQKVADNIINNGMSVCDSNYLLNYYRLSADNRLLFGSDSSNNTDMIVKMRKNMLNVFPHLESVKIDYGWGGPIDMTLNSAPHFGRIQPNLYFAQGFSGHGVALTGLAGRIISEAICGNDERLAIFEQLNVPSLWGGKLVKKAALYVGMRYYRFLDKFC